MDGSSIDRVLAESRRHLERVEPEQLAEEIADGALVVDIRPAEVRDAEGLLPGALVVDRNVLEWRLGLRRATDLVGGYRAWRALHAEASAMECTAL